MLELSRVVASKPTDYKANMQATMETMSRRQECAIAFGTTLFREQSEMTSDVSERAKEMFAPLQNANIDLMAPYKSMTKFWASAAK
jgi:type IV secretory pathway TraG/TraD family ATPase VirD4